MIGPRTAATLLVLLIFSACGASERRNLFGSRVERMELIEITVDNTELRDRTVWAYWQGQMTRVRLGVVSGRSTRTFVTPWRSQAVKFVSSDRVEYYPVRPGDHLTFAIGGATSMIPRRVRP